VSKEPERERDEGVARLIAFSDGVFAIAMTLLVLQLGVPSFKGEPTERQLWHALAQWSAYAAFVLSFVIIGLYWLVHHRTFRQIAHADAVLLWLNLIFLLGITFMPFPTAVFERFANERPAVMLYAGALAAVGFAWFALWWYASSKPDLLVPRIAPDTIASERRRALVPPLIFSLSLVVAWFAPGVAPYTWLLLFGQRFLYRLHRR